MKKIFGFISIFSIILISCSVSNKTASKDNKFGKCIIVQKEIKRNDSISSYPIKLDSIDYILVTNKEIGPVKLSYKVSQFVYNHYNVGDIIPVCSKP